MIRQRRYRKVPTGGTLTLALSDKLQSHAHAHTEELHREGTTREHPHIGKKHSCDFFPQTDTLGLHLSEHCKDERSGSQEPEKNISYETRSPKMLESQMLAAES